MTEAAHEIEHSTEVARHGTVERMPAAENNAVTPMTMIDRALVSGAAPETLEKLLALQERWEANQGRKAFDEAVSNAKAKIPPIQRNKQGHNNKKYADFAALARVVDPIISQFGLSYRFRTNQDTNLIKVTCILSHRDGHSEETTLAGPADTSGSKNAIQAIGSTLTYLQRYSLTQALGLAASDDDDGHAATAGGTVSEEQVDAIRTLIEEAQADVEKFCRHWKINAVIDLPARQFDDAMKSLRAFANRQAKEGQTNG